MARRTTQEPASNRSHRPTGPAKSRPPGGGRARPKSGDDTTSHRGTKSGQDRNARDPVVVRSLIAVRSRVTAAVGWIAVRSLVIPGSPSSRRDPVPAQSPSGQAPNPSAARSLFAIRGRPAALESRRARNLRRVRGLHRVRELHGVRSPVVTRRANACKKCFRAQAWLHAARPKTGFVPAVSP
jgi:hypothetical protein